MLWLGAFLGAYYIENIFMNGSKQIHQIKYIHYVAQPSIFLVFKNQKKHSINLQFSKSYLSISTTVVLKDQSNKNNIKTGLCQS